MQFFKSITMLFALALATYACTSGGAECDLSVENTCCAPYECTPAGPDGEVGAVSSIFYQYSFWYLRLIRHP